MEHHNQPEFIPHLPQLEHPVEHKPNDSVTISAKFLRFFGIVIVLTVLIGGAFSYFKNRFDATPQSYDECVASPGSRIQESYPATCVTLEGSRFVQPITTPVLLPGNSSLTPSQTALTPIPSSTIILQCKRMGCSGQYCVDINSQDIVTTCEYRPEYSCYQEAPCEKQADGQCGFTPSDGLTMCLQKASENPGYE